MIEFLLRAAYLFCVGFIAFYAIMNLVYIFAYKPGSPNYGEPNPERVAVLVPVRDDPSIFNSHPHLASMDYPDYKVFVLDDSTDAKFKAELKALSSKKTEVIERREHIGRKSGALNYGLDAIGEYKPTFVAVFDCDHRPPSDFLRKAVATIEHTGVDCVCGYQKHDINADTLFRKVYQANHACAIVNFKGRNRLGMFTIFGGGCGIFRYEWLRAHKFDPTSITEDWELSLRTYLRGDFRIFIMDDLYAHAAIPRAYRWFITQQLRWSEGTIADLRKYFRKIMFGSKLTLKDKIGILYQGLYYTISIPVLATVAIYLAMPSALPPWWVSTPLAVFFGLSWLAAYLVGPRHEGFGRVLTVKTVIFAFVLAVVMAPVYAYSTIMGLTRRRGFWIVTRRTG